ncbi:hypothetical protein H4R35_002687 [Dimargaris xerosporica]|nr:hypothetical protein H4R35_002687 [Dimargaris xerosporica]
MKFSLFKGPGSSPNSAPPTAPPQPPPSALCRQPSNASTNLAIPASAQAPPCFTTYPVFVMSSQLPHAGGGYTAMPMPQPTSYGISTPTVADSPYATGNAYATGPAVPQPAHNDNSGHNLQLPPGVIPVSVPHGSDLNHSFNASTATPPPATNQAEAAPAPTEMTSFDGKPGGPTPVFSVYTDMTKPTLKKELLRFVQLLGSIGALGFSAGATPRSNHDVPFDDRSPLNYLYFVSGLSCLVSLFFVLSYLWRFSRPLTPKQRFFTMFGVDMLMVLFWVSCIVALLAKTSCAVGTLDGWCDFFNTSIFFSFLAGVGFIIAVAWDSVVFIKCRRHSS